jgi:transposase
MDLLRKAMETATYTSQVLDHLGIVAGICHEIGLIEQIDQRVTKRDSPVSVGQAVQAMVINALGFVSHPLYLSPEFFQNKPVDLLVGEAIEAAQLDDNCLGRSLDRLFEAGITELFAAVAAHALGVFGIAVRQAHLDTTSMSLHGEYDVDDGDDPDVPQAIQITHGYSRDHRPDLKQAMLCLICANASSLPVWLAALDGNQSDHKHFPQLVDAYIQQLKGDAETPLLVADSALYNQTDLPAMSEVANWITRVPGTLAAVQELYTAIDPNDMLIIDEKTRCAEVGSYYGGVKQRWLLVLHEPTRQHQQTTLERRIAKERDQAERALWHLSNREFDCEDAIHKVLAPLERDWKYHRAEIEMVTEQRYARRGRPTPDAQREVWKFIGQVVADETRIAAAQAGLGKYVIATNQLDAEKLPIIEWLNIYKAQSTTVERGFRFLKDPMFFAHSLFLKKPSRIMALLMVMGLSLLVYSLAELHLRAQLAEHDESIPDQKGKPTQNPTMRRVFQMFEGIHVLTIQRGTVRERMILNLTDLHRQILRLFNPSVQHIYQLGLGP